MFGRKKRRDPLTMLSDALVQLDTLMDNLGKAHEAIRAEATDKRARIVALQAEAEQLDAAAERASAIRNNVGTLIAK